MSDNILFTPFQLKRLTLKNRIGVAPMTRMSSPGDSLPRQDVLDFLIRRAKNGAAIVYTEAIITDYESAQGYPGQARMLTQRQIGAWQPVVKAIQDEGSVAIMQMFHCGRMSWPEINPANRVIGIWKRIKSDMSNVIGIAGGPHATVFPEELLGAGFDFVVRGEGESTISEIVDLLNGKIKIQEVRGLSYIEAGKMCHNDNRPLISDLDSLPYPAWHYFPLDLYHSEFKRSDLCLPIITSRGCPSHCVFCYKGLFGNRFRARSPEKIVEEISLYIRRYGIEEFAIVDDNFTSIPKRVIRFCELLLEKKLPSPGRCLRAFGWIRPQSSCFLHLSQQDAIGLALEWSPAMMTF